MKVLFYTYPNYYKADFLGRLRNSSGLEISELTSCDIMRDLCAPIFKNESDSLKFMWNILWKSKRDELYLCSEAMLEKMLASNFSLSFKRCDVLRRTFGLIKNILDEYQLWIKNSYSLYEDGENKFAFFLNSDDRGQAFQTLDKLVFDYVKTHEVILIPGTNRSIASPLIGSKKIIKYLQGIDKINIELLEKIVDFTCGPHFCDIISNFFDTLIVTLIYKHAIKLQLPMISLCHGAQIGYIYLGGYIDYSLRRYKPCSWNLAKVEFGPDHPVRRYFGLRTSYVGDYYNTVFMSINSDFPIKNLNAITRKYSDLNLNVESGLSSFWDVNEAFVEYYNFHNIHGLQLHIENTIEGQNAIIKYINNLINNRQKVFEASFKDIKFGPKLTNNNYPNLYLESTKGFNLDDDKQELYLSTKIHPNKL